MRWYNKNKTRMININAINHYFFTKGPISSDYGRSNRLWITIGGQDITLYDEEGLEVYNILNKENKSE